jgi:hypothetical protein
MPVVCLEPARHGSFPFLLHGIFVPVNCPGNFAAHKRRTKKFEIMNTKLVMTMALAAVLGAGAVWFTAPQRSNAAETNSVSKKILHYTCPMHPSVRADKPGDCPVCGMRLVPVYAPSTNAAPVTKISGCCGGQN